MIPDSSRRIKDEPAIIKGETGRSGDNIKGFQQCPGEG
jgi:hypothetical protein